MEPKAFIGSIREDYRSHNKLARDNQMHSLKLLSEDLYAKDTHFIFELIQNAEDNDYAPGVKPSLRITIEESEDLTYRGPALIIENNERGFRQDQVAAICKIGQSTKAGAKAAGYIGEKGIGFKSVFRVSDCPRVYSNGYRFALPKKDPETGLGYIVPLWLEELPAYARTNWTTIVLPLSERNAQEIAVRALDDVAPETLMFLRHLRELAITISLPSDDYALTIEKLDATYPLVELVYQVREDSEEALETRAYWIASQEFERPAAVSDEGRAGIDSRDVSVAIPLSSEGDSAKLFAYLPVWDNTGVPFLINADFQLTSSREDVHEDKPWNVWLRDHIAEVYVKAFMEALHSPRLDLDQKSRLYASIPLSTHHRFLDPILEDISVRLNDEACVLVWKSEKCRRPNKARLASEAFYSLFEESDGLPAPLRSEFALAHRNLLPHGAQLEAIGVEVISDSEILDGLDDPDWLKTRPLEWFLDLYRFLGELDEPDETRLRSLAIVPIATSQGRSRLSCESQRPIYLPGGADATELMRRVPAWLSEWVPIDFVQYEFMDLVNGQQDAAKLTSWMQSALNIYELTLRNYCADLLAKLETHHDELSDAQLVEATRFIADTVDADFSWSGQPILLNDGRRVFLQGHATQRLVVPETFDREAGWQHIWTDPADRSHFGVLSNAYATFPSEWFLRCGISRFPAFASLIIREAEQCLNPVEKDLLAHCLDAAAYAKRYAVCVHSHRCPSSLQGSTISEETAKAIQAFLRSASQSWPTGRPTEHQLHSSGLLVKGTYQNRTEYYVMKQGAIFKALSSLPWLPTTKGLMAPTRAFLPTPGIKELLGDTVPYVDCDLPTALLTTLGVSAAVTEREILRLLAQLSGDRRVEKTSLHRLYEALYIRWRLDPSIDLSAFEAGDLVYVPGTNGQPGGQWHHISSCVWKDPGEDLSEGIVCLDKHYPTLHNLFVEALGAKEQLDKEVFAKRWLIIQDGPPIEPEKIQSVIGRLYRELRPIALLEAPKRPEWWKDFYRNAKVFTQSDGFDSPKRMVVPDNVELRKAFEEAGIELQYAWRPEKDSFSDWKPFFDVFEVPLLSSCVTEQLSERIDLRPSDERRYVTAATVLLCAAWLREEQSFDYERLLASGTFKTLLELREAAIEKEAQLTLTLSLDGSKHRLVKPSSVYWDKVLNTLAYHQHTPPRVLKQQLAIALAKQLLGNRAYKKFADWLELVLEETDTHRLEAKGWSAPMEVTKLIQQQRKAEAEGVLEASIPAQPTPAAASSLRDSEPHVPAFPPQASTPQPVIPEPNAPNSIAPGPTAHQDPEPPAEDSYATRLTRAFERKGEESLGEKWQDLDYYGSNRVGNVARRAGKLTEKIVQAVGAEPKPEERRTVTERSILEGANPSVRAALLEWYQGKCQICDKTWPDRSGQPFFVAAYIEERRNARWLDHEANALCLCAEHFAQWRHASIAAPMPIVEQLERLQVKGEGQDLTVEFQMLGRPHRIRYCEKHLLALKSMLDASR